MNPYRPPSLAGALSIAVAAALAPPSLALAADLDRLQNLGSQADFRNLTGDLGAALIHRSISPATPLGITGFDVGVDASVARLGTNAFGVASGGTDKSLPVARLRVQKGLPFSLDAGLSIGVAPGTNIRVVGGELRYALIDGGLVSPAVAVRGSVSRLNGVSQLGLDTRALDVSVSKGFVGLTPYAGAGRVWVTGTPQGVAGLSKQSVGLNRVFVGVNLGVALFAGGLEADRTGGVTTVSAKLSLRW
jgi:hypothetical protein